MKKCPHCAEEIQNEALVCKHCGRDLKPPKNKTSVATVGCLSVVILVGIVFIASRFDTPAPSLVPVNAGMRATGVALFITNAGAEEWTSFEVRVGDVISGYRFSSPGARVAPKQEVEVPLTVFATKSGERFNPLTRAPTEVWIQVITRTGLSDWRQYRLR